MIANLILGLAALASAVVAIYVVLNAELFLMGVGATALFLGLPSAVCLGSVVALLLERRRKLQIVLLGISIGLSLLGMELGLFLIDGYQQDVADRRKAEGIARLRETAASYDDRDIRTFLTENWERGRSLYPRIFQLPRRVLEVDGVPTFPTSSLSGREIVECFAAGQYKVYRSDEYGFANPEGLHERPVQVVLVGDSFTAGECVPVEDDIGSHLRRRYPRTISLGVGGAGPLWSLANLIEYGLPLEPRWVFWLYTESNDLADLGHEVRYSQLRGYLEGEPQGLRARKDRVDRHVASVQRTELEALVRMDPVDQAQEVDLLVRAADVMTLKRLRRRLGLHRDQLVRLDADEEPVRWLERVLVHARDLVERQGGRFVLVYVPDPGRFLGFTETHQREHVVRMLDRNKIRWIDLLELLEQHPDVMSLFPFRSMGHFNPQGYEFVAREILAHIDGQSETPEAGPN